MEDAIYVKGREDGYEGRKPRAMKDSDYMAGYFEGMQVRSDEAHDELVMARLMLGPVRVSC